MAALGFPSSEASVLLAEFAKVPQILVALDFDGTVAELSNEPMAVRALSENKVVLAELLEQPGVSLAFVSGRSMADLLLISEQGDDSPFYLAGSHGAELKLPGKAVQGTLNDSERVEIDKWRRAAELEISEIPDAWVEAKSMGFAVHFRRCSPQNKQRVKEILAGTLDQELSSWRRRGGHDIVEYAIRDTGKDAAVSSLRDRIGVGAVLFAGDDDTDEDALASLADSDLGVRVGGAVTAANIRVDSPSGLAILLNELLDLRKNRVS